MRGLPGMSEQLIYAMSTNENMKISDFNKYFRETYQSEYPELFESLNLRHQMIRTLDSLGYCEFDYDKNMVYMCRPSLVLLPLCGLPKAMLVGARTPHFIDRLKNFVRELNGDAILFYHHHPKTYINIPPVIYIEANSIENIEHIANKMKIECHTKTPASWELANFSSSINQMKKKINFEHRTEPNWLKKTFDSRLLHFSRSISDNSDSISFVSYRNPTNQQLYHLLWMEDEAAEIERDWGRYFMLSQLHRNILFYDEKSYQLAVPATVPLPCILARAIAMCNGTTPKLELHRNLEYNQVPLNHPILIYSGVTPTIASLVGKKIDQKLTAVSFEDLGG
jgi:hypothetical protein